MFYGEFQFGPQQLFKTFTLYKAQLIYIIKFSSFRLVRLIEE
jgi:hypothetical protein